MVVHSFFTDGGNLKPVTVELSLWPGLPGIQFVGLADQHLKESAHRIKSAIRSQGFKFPRAQQILVNLRPSHIKKNSMGLELAVAAAFLWETEQIPRPKREAPVFVYGELTLGGEVLAPADLFHIEGELPISVLTGPHASEHLFERQVIDNLQSLAEPEIKQPSSDMPVWQRPERFQNFTFSKDEARLLEILASGEHSILFAGPAGSGKSTLAHVVHSLLEEPSPKWWNQYKSHDGDREINWRPLNNPHHSVPKATMLGGAFPVKRGEMSKADGGILILDEMLEFDPSVIEGLREPMESGKMRVARLGQARDWPCNPQVISTTNLCPCGDGVPGETFRKPCRYSLIKCRSYSQRLSGPLLDRFQMLAFTKGRRKPEVDWSEVLSRVLAAIEFRRNIRNQTEPNSRADFEPWKTPEVEFLLPEGVSSERRKIATLRVARTLADLDQSVGIEAQHIEEASLWTYLNFERLKHWD